MEDAWCTTIMCLSVVGPVMCFFWIEMFVWVRVLKSRPIANERMGRKGDCFCLKEEGKEAFDVVYTSLNRD